MKKEYENQFNAYRYEDMEENKNYITDKLSKLLIHQLIKQINLDELLRDFDAVCLCPSAMWVEKSIFPRIETGYVFTEDMNDELMERFNIQTFTQGSAILKIKYYNPKYLIVQQLPVKEREKKIEINRMRNG